VEALARVRFARPTARRRGLRRVRRRRTPSNAAARDASACGGCFHPQAETSVSVITDHRMAFKISTDETVLWDQVRYSGDPTEFAWVLPVRAGAKIELSRDEWIASLDATTKTTVTGPEVFCSGGRATSTRSGSGGGGCGGGDTLMSFSSAEDGSEQHDQDASSFQGSGGVEIVSQSVIGPYQAVTIHSTDGTGMSGWLLSNGFAIPDEVVPVIDAYTAERFDFIALRLRPGQGTRAMRPVRVVTPGADTTLPLRMVAAGVGEHVGLTLWIIAEGRYHTQNFPDSRVDWSRLAWDPKLGRSNMSDLVADALASNERRGWITEAAVRDRGGVGFSVAPSVFQTYESTCVTRAPHTAPCDETALPPADGSPDDAGAPEDEDADEDASAGDAGAGADAADASAAPPPEPPPASSCTKLVSGCDGFDDYEVATRGLHPDDVWITRLRADLPSTALTTDLRLEAAEQVEDAPRRSTTKFTDPSYDPCAGTSGSSSAAPSGDRSGGCTCRGARFQGDVGSFALMAFTALGASVIARRRRR
jgi:hypothetical protein